MATTSIDDPAPGPPPPTKVSHRGEPAPLPVWIMPLVIGCCILIVFAFIALILTPVQHPNRRRGATTPILSVPRPDATARPFPTPTPEPTDLVARAQQIKPLEDISKGDRVLYQGHVCVWELWDKDINTSTIKCPGQKAFQIQTGRLTPVELKTGPSKLKVEH